MSARRASHSHRSGPQHAQVLSADLFGGFAVVKEWGRIGARGGRLAGEWHLTEAQALAAAQRQAERKRRRGYSPDGPT
jgi:predicted DNA-binding WGR domain protein